MKEINEHIESLMRQDPDKAFKLIYEHYYSLLCNVSYKILYDADAAEDVVQEVLLEFYNKRDQITISTSVQAYLRRSVYNRSLNHLKQKSRTSEDEEALLNHEDSSHGVVSEMIMSETLNSVNKVIESLPEKCRYVFTLSRFEEKSYAEIAEIMDISVKTVENQISKALKILRSSLEVKKNALG